MTTCEHEWIVISTALLPPTIMVNCNVCNAFGGVLEHTAEEWALAYYAPSMPFRWADDDRVILLADLPEPTPEDWQRWHDFVSGRREGRETDPDIFIDEAMPHDSDIVHLTLMETELGRRERRLGQLIDDMDLFHEGENDGGSF